MCLFLSPDPPPFPYTPRVPSIHLSQRGENWSHTLGSHVQLGGRGRERSNKTCPAFVRPRETRSGGGGCCVEDEGGETKSVVTI